ncbi:MAG: HAD-IIIC family phosphatase, partial [Lachnospiraceae bacterium]|nr:HAD-IIIC family phosphatase [Lachnospiraceae bacterium]
MDYFSQPLDTKTLLRKKKSIKKELLASDIVWIEKKIAILGGSTTNEVADQLELFLLHQGIKANFYQSEYGKFYEDAVFGNPGLDEFCPDIVYIHTNWRNIKEFPSINSSLEEAEALLRQEYERFAAAWEALRKRYGCLIIQNNFDRPDYRLLGNRDIWDFRGRSNFIFRLNQLFYTYAQKSESFFINDIDYIAQEYGLSEWGNPLYWYMYKYACCLDAIPYVAWSVANIVKSVYGKNKKLLALDLDNTLWKGVIGDDGVEGIEVGPETPGGQAYHDFQKYCKDLQRIGVLLAVDSKNNEHAALEGLGHPDGVLKKEDFVSIQANWEPKSDNLMRIAKELSLGVESFVFVDDNPAEREIVKSQLPMVEAPVMDHPEKFIKTLDHCGYFEPTIFSSEDADKTEQYRARSEAIREQARFANYEEYLSSLEMKAVIAGFEPIYIQRIAQLTNKTNQFNLTTLRLNADELKKMYESGNYICLCGRLIDKFADNGIVSVAAGEIEKDVLHIRLWLMSCRVLKRGMEFLMMNTLLEETAKKGLKKIMGYYYPA